MDHSSLYWYMNGYYEGARGIVRPIVRLDMLPGWYHDGYSDGRGDAARGDVLVHDDASPFLESPTGFIMLAVSWHDNDPHTGLPGTKLYFADPGLDAYPTDVHAWVMTESYSKWTPISLDKLREV